MKFFPPRHEHNEDEVLAIIEQNPTKFRDLSPSRNSTTNVRKSTRRCIDSLTEQGKIKLVYIGQEPFYVSANWNYDPKILHFEEKCKHSVCGCIEWVGYINKKRGPMMRFGGNSSVSVRRKVWEMNKGVELDEKDRIEMTCGNDSCVKFEHMKKSYTGKNRRGEKRNIVSRQRMMLASRKAFGKLDMEKAEEIRASKEPLRVFAEKFGVSIHAVSLARLGKTWKPIQETGGLFSGLLR